MQRTLTRMFQLPKLFRFSKTPDILTLFHSPSSPTSVAILNYLKEAQIPPGTLKPNTPPRYELDIIVEPGLPTSSQYKSIVEFLGGESHARKVLRGVQTMQEGANRLAEKDEGGKSGVEIELVRPIVVDWNNGRVIIGGRVEEVKKLVETLPED